MARMNAVPSPLSHRPIRELPDELISQMDMMERLGNSDVDTVHAIAAYKRDIKDRRIRLIADEKSAASAIS